MLKEREEEQPETRSELRDEGALSGRVARKAAVGWAMAPGTLQVKGCNRLPLSVGLLPEQVWAQMPLGSLRSSRFREFAIGASNLDTA